MFVSDASSRFDWTLRRSYDYLDQLTYRDRAWECLRRHPEFQTAWWRARDMFEIAFSDSTLTIIHAREKVPGLEKFGCLFSGVPDFDARTANIFWLPAWAPSILPMQALAAGAPMNAPPLDLRHLGCSVAILQMPDGMQHVTLRAGNQTIQLAVSGASVVEPVHLLGCFMFGSAELCRQLETLRQFDDLVAGTPLPPPIDQQTFRFRQVLQALDGSLAGASHRDIAIAWVGIERVEAEWNDPRQNLRDRVRRAVKRGHDLMNGGYRLFLR